MLHIEIKMLMRFSLWKKRKSKVKDSCRRSVVRLQHVVTAVSRRRVITLVMSWRINASIKNIGDGHARNLYSSLTKCVQYLISSGHTTSKSTRLDESSAHEHHQVWIEDHRQTSPLQRKKNTILLSGYQVSRWMSSNVNRADMRSSVGLLTLLLHLA